MAMSKEDFEVVAAVINQTSLMGNSARSLFALDMAVALRYTNPNFNGETFIRACMHSSVPGTTLEHHWDEAVNTYTHMVSRNTKLSK